MTKQVMKPRRKAKLPQAPPMEPRHKRTLIVVADGARARFFEPRHDGHTLVPASQTNLVSTSPLGLMFSTMRATHISAVGWKTTAPDQTPEKDRRIVSIAESGGVMA